MKMKTILSIYIGLSTLMLSAQSLRTVVSDVLDTNPLVKSRLHHYEVIKANIDIAEAGYYPTLNLESSSGRKTTGRINNNVITETYNVFQNSLRLKQHIFDGFSTNETVRYQKMRTLSASYNYLSTVNDIALKVVISYIEIEKEKALLKNSQLNVQHNDMTYKKVQKSYKSGLSTFSEVSKIHASLSLARSNLMLQKNKLHTAKHKFKRVVGIHTDPEVLAKIPSKLSLPKNEKEAETYAMEYSPVILAGKYNIQGAKALYRESKSAFYPKVDLELSQSYNENYNEYIGTDDRTQGLIVVSYNLYNGGADEAKKLQSLSKIDQEVSLVNDLKREVALNIQLAWSSYQLALEQMPFIKLYQKESKKTLKLYSSEYQLGKRSLLDLISAENDLKRANDERIYARYGLLQAKYSIMHAMGLIIIAILHNEEAYYQRVGINGKSKTVHTLNYNSISTAIASENIKKENIVKKEKSISVTKIQPIQKKSSLFNERSNSLSPVGWKSR